ALPASLATSRVGVLQQVQNAFQTVGHRVFATVEACAGLLQLREAAQQIDGVEGQLAVLVDQLGGWASGQAVQAGPQAAQVRPDSIVAPAEKEPNSKNSTAGSVWGAGVNQQAVDETPSARLPPAVGCLQRQQQHLLHRLWAVRLGLDKMACQLESPTAQQFAGTEQASAAIEWRFGDSLAADLGGGAKQASVRANPSASRSRRCTTGRSQSPPGTTPPSGGQVGPRTAGQPSRNGRHPGKSTATSQILANVRHQTAEVDELLTERKPRQRLSAVKTCLSLAVLCQRRCTSCCSELKRSTAPWLAWQPPAKRRHPRDDSLASAAVTNTGASSIGSAVWTIAGLMSAQLRKDSSGGGGGGGSCCCCCSPRDGLGKLAAASPDGLLEAGWQQEDGGFNADAKTCCNNELKWTDDKPECVLARFELNVERQLVNSYLTAGLRVIWTKYDSKNCTLLFTLDQRSQGSNDQQNDELNKAVDYLIKVARKRLLLDRVSGK
uniref:Pecanex_C domain-containing protein n=1 Tax=Macrostomum lignano TaxID=282301 RepID=A0A1I8FU12_9PLAT